MVTLLGNQMCRKVGADAGTGNNACDQGTKEAFTQAALPMDAKTSFIKGQNTEARCVRPEVIHPHITMKAATPHIHRSLQFISGMHARATPYLGGRSGMKM